MNTFRSLVAVLLLTMVPLTTMGQKVKVIPDWAKASKEQKPKEEKEMTIRKEGNEKVTFNIIRAYRYADAVKVEFCLINEDKVPLKGLTLGTSGFYATEVVSNIKENFGGFPIIEYYHIRELQWGKVYDYEGGRKITIHEIKPGESVHGWMLINDVDYKVKRFLGMSFKFRRNITTHYSKDVDVKTVFFHAENVPIETFEISEKGVGRLDCSLPISKFPKRLYKFYDRIETEEIVNEMDGYTETSVKFYMGNELVMVGISTDEGAEKRLDQMNFYSKLITTPEGLAPGMPLQKFVEKGAYLKMQYYGPWWLVQGDNYISSWEGNWYEKLGSAVTRHYEGQHESNMTRGNNVTKFKLTGKTFKTDIKIPCITRFYK